MIKDDKLVFVVYPNEYDARRAVVRINDKAWEAVQKIQRETGFTYSRIVSEMILYANQHYEIKEG